MAPPPTPRSRHSRRKNFLRATSATAAVAALAVGVGKVRGQALGEPPEGQVYFGAWIDTQAGFSDTPSAFNARLGRNVPVFQVSQQIPRLPFNYTTGAGGPAPENLIEKSGTDAHVFLTVYPVDGLDTVTQADLDDLASQLSDYNTLNNRTAFLRYAPEMQGGTWNRYGNQPYQFVQQWQNMYTTVKTANPNTIVVWAPNTGEGYPYGQDFPNATWSLYPEQDQALLDSNGDGQLTSADDPYYPYWPGYDYVDWMGISVYYKGPDGGSSTTNAVEPSGFCQDIFAGTEPLDGSTLVSFYDAYCANQTTRACMMSESGAAWHPDSTGSEDLHVQIASQWIADCIANPTWFSAMPRIKMVMNFEYQKEEDDLRDYRLTNDTDVRAALQAGFSSVEGLYYWANPRAIPTSVSSAGSGGATGNYSTPPAVVTNTKRVRSTDAPSLFGDKHVGGGVLQEVVELTVVVTCGVVGMWTVARWL